MSKRDASPWWTPLAAYQFLPKVDAIVSLLNEAYRGAGRKLLKERAVLGASFYDADTVAQDYWQPVLADIEQAAGLWESAT